MKSAVVNYFHRLRLLAALAPGSPTMGDAGEFNIDHLEYSNYWIAAHEYGHVLGYFIDKYYPDGTYNSNAVGKNTHSYHKLGAGEEDYIMGTWNLSNPTKNRMHAIEVSRLNHGQGISYPRNFSSEFNRGIAIGNTFLFPPKLK